MRRFRSADNSPIRPQSVLERRCSLTAETLPQQARDKVDTQRVHTDAQSSKPNQELPRVMQRFGEFEAQPVQVQQLISRIQATEQQSDRHTAFKALSGTLPIPLPQFDGAAGKSFVEWLNRFNVSTLAGGLNDNERLRILPAFLSDRAFEIYRSFLYTVPEKARNYSELIQRLVKAFDSIDPQHLAINEWVNRVQQSNESTTEYMHAMKMIARKAMRQVKSEIRNQFLIVLFMKGLRPGIKSQLTTVMPTTVDEAEELAARIEIARRDWIGLLPSDENVNVGYTHVPRPTIEHKVSATEAIPNRANFWTDHPSTQAELYVNSTAAIVTEVSQLRADIARNQHFVNKPIKNNAYKGRNIARGRRSLLPLNQQLNQKITPVATLVMEPCYACQEYGHSKRDCPTKLIRGYIGHKGKSLGHKVHHCTKSKKCQPLGYKAKQYDSQKHNNEVTHVEAATCEPPAEIKQLSADTEQLKIAAADIEGQQVSVKNQLPELQVPAQHMECNIVETEGIANDDLYICTLFQEQPTSVNLNPIMNSQADGMAHEATTVSAQDGNSGNMWQGTGQVTDWSHKLIDVLDPRPCELVRQNMVKLMVTEAIINKKAKNILIDSSRRQKKGTLIARKVKRGLARSFDRNPPPSLTTLLSSGFLGRQYEYYTYTTSGLYARLIYATWNLQKPVILDDKIQQHLDVLEMVKPIMEVGYYSSWDVDGYEPPMDPIEDGRKAIKQMMMSAPLTVHSAITQALWTIDRITILGRIGIGRGMKPSNGLQVSSQLHKGVLEAVNTDLVVFPNDQTICFTCEDLPAMNNRFKSRDTVLCEAERTWDESDHSKCQWNVVWISNPICRDPACQNDHHNHADYKRIRGYGKPHSLSSDIQTEVHCVNGTNYDRKFVYDKYNVSKFLDNGNATVSDQGPLWTTASSQKA